MNRYFLPFVLMPALLLPVSVVSGDDDVKASANISIGAGQDLWAGQQITLYLDLKTTGFSFSNTRFNLPEVKDGFLMQTDTTTIKLTEKTNGQDWQVVRYPLAFYPQQSGILEIPPVNVRFSTSSGYGREEKDFEFQTNPMELSVKSPPGVKPGELVITTSSFQLDYNWQPETGAAKVGDAVTLTVKRSAGDISAMLLPPLPVFRTDGLAAYPQSPLVQDRTDRGDLTGERSDSITWVVEKPGTYEVPGIRFQWWDPVRSELKQQVVPGLSMDIMQAGNDTPDSANGASERQRWTILKPLLLVLTAGLLAVTGWLRFSKKPGAQTADNERAAFGKLKVACKTNSTAQAHAAIHSWISFLPIKPPGNPQTTTLKMLGNAIGDNRLEKELIRLEEALVLFDSNWQGKRLLALLQDARDEINRQDPATPHTQLLPLNP